MYDTKSGGNPGQFPAANNCEAVMAPRREQHRQELNADPKRTQFHPDRVARRQLPRPNSN